MSFHNRIRLPLTIDRPQYSATREVYTKANGDTKTLSSVLKKTYQGKTDWLPEHWHERLIVALNHDTVVIEGEKYLGGVALDGDSAYQIDWDEIFRTAIAGAKFQVLVTPFDNSNNNCMTCDQASQIALVDDVMPTNLAENTSYTIDVITNDSICCYPVTFTITDFNSDYLSSCTIDADGTAHLHTKSGVVAINGIKLFTYRATCSDGAYDEADVTGNVNGTVPGCLAPTGLHSTAVGSTSADFEWTPPSPVPDHYFWQLLSDTNVVLMSGDVSSPLAGFTTLTANTNYKFQVRSACAAGDSDANASNWIQVPFTTAPLSPGLCGSFRLFPTAGGSTGTITYLGCDGAYHSIAGSLLTPVTICALQSSPGVYTDIHSTFTSMTVTYMGLCGLPTPTLLLQMINGGAFIQFKGFYSSTVDAPTSIDQIFANGYTAGDCSTASNASAHSSFVIPAFNTTGGASAISSTGPWSSDHSYKLVNVKINGVAVSDGDIIVIGSYSVQVVIHSCN